MTFIHLFHVLKLTWTGWLVYRKEDAITKKKMEISLVDFIACEYMYIYLALESKVNKTERNR